MNPLFYCVIAFTFIFQSTGTAQSGRSIFLHHSTGRMIYNDGHVADSIYSYNEKHGTNYSISERSYPDKPYVWANYPYDYWNIWINGYCNEQKDIDTYSNIACLEDICKEYDVVILKHCYPGADVLENVGSPDITSSRKSLENYKLQYRALRDKFQEFPDNDFIIWTLVPRHRLKANSPINAIRAKEFVDWVKDVWLSENGEKYPNIHIFDYFSLAAELNTDALAPRVPYCLKYEYELSHEDSDSHPNLKASQEIGPEFYRFIVDVFENRQRHSINSN